MASTPSRATSLSTHLVAFAAAILVPLSILSGLLLVEEAHLKRQQMEDRIIGIAADLADDIDRELSYIVTTLATLATSPALRQVDLSTFHAQASAVAPLLGGRIVLIDSSSLQQIVNTLVPWSTPLPATGDIETAQRVLDTAAPQVSNYFVGTVSLAPTVTVEVPVIVSGEVLYVLGFAMHPDRLLAILHAEDLEPGRVAAVYDGNGVILARTLGHEQLVGRQNPRYEEMQNATQDLVIKTISIEGEPVLRAVMRSGISGWLMVSNLSVDVAEAPMQSSLLLWGIGTAAAALLTLVLASVMARTLSLPINQVSMAARAIGRGERIAPMRSHLNEANAVIDALASAGAAIAERAEAQKRWERRQSLLLAELNHRVKNTLTVVQALAMRSLTDNHTMAAARTLLFRRLRALARAQDILVASNWQGAAIHQIVATELSLFAERASIEGPDVVVTPTVAQAVALVTHELASNALKYGAFSNGTGRVNVTLSIAGAGETARLRFRWQEVGGPPVAPPIHKGFGSILLERAIVTDLDVKPLLAFERDGVTYYMDVPLAAIAAVAGSDALAA